MYNLPFRRTILQSTLRFFMDALTFIQIQNSKVKNQNPIVKISKPKIQTLLF